MVSHRRTAGPARSSARQGLTATTLTAAVTAASAALVPSAGAAPSPHTSGGRPGQVRAEVARLHAEAERAGDAYQQADGRAETLGRRLATVQDRTARAQDEVNSLRRTLGSLAGAQYREGGADPSLQLLLSRDPESYLRGVSTMERVGARNAGQLRALEAASRDLARQRAEAARTLAELRRSRAELARHKRAVTSRIARAKELLGTLPAEERDPSLRASRSERWPLGGPVASARAAVALAAARSALGRPYVWGASGPSSFDCSGLTQWAYAQAGVSLPRTSQAQRGAGRQVPLSEARPGDLVVYRGDASHVGMYAGGGQVVHAPYPGAPVRLDPVGMMPVNAVTRV